MSRGRGPRTGRASPEGANVAYAPSAEVFRLAGRLAVPAIVIDERVFLGFGGHRDEIEAQVRE